MNNALVVPHPITGVSGFPAPESDSPNYRDAIKFRDTRIRPLDYSKYVTITTQIHDNLLSSWELFDFDNYSDQLFDSDNCFDNWIPSLSGHSGPRYLVTHRSIIAFITPP